MSPRETLKRQEQRTCGLTSNCMPTVLTVNAMQLPEVVVDVVGSKEKQPRYIHSMCGTGAEALQRDNSLGTLQALLTTSRNGSSLNTACSIGAPVVFEVWMQSRKAFG
jgi:hypothetical protein